MQTSTVLLAGRLNSTMIGTVDATAPTTKIKHFFLIFKVLLQKDVTRTA